MSCTPSDFETCGEALLAEGAAEIDIRCATSRFYYSAFHSALSFHATLPSPGAAPAGSFGVHESLIKQLINPTIKNGDSRFGASRKAGYMLIEMRKNRVKADYDLDASFGDADALKTQADLKQIQTILGT